jgi:hypothetical protein
MKNAVSWDVSHVALVITDVSEECIASIIRMTTIIVFLRSMLRLLVTADVVPTPSSLVILMMEAIPSSVTSVYSRATRRTVPENGILHSHHRKNLKFYIALTDCAL